MTKTIKTRIQQKHDIEANWLLATNFIPMAGEIIIYDIDDTYTYERFKIGDGKTVVSALPFAVNPHGHIDLEERIAALENPNVELLSNEITFNPPTHEGQIDIDPLGLVAGQYYAVSGTYGANNTPFTQVMEASAPEPSAPALTYMHSSESDLINGHLGLVIYDASGEIDGQEINMHFIMTGGMGSGQSYNDEFFNTPEYSPLVVSSIAAAKPEYAAKSELNTLTARVQVLEELINDDGNLLSGAPISITEPNLSVAGMDVFMLDISSLGLELGKQYKLTYTYNQTKTEVNCITVANDSGGIGLQEITETDYLPYSASFENTAIMIGDKMAGAGEAGYVYNESSALIMAMPINGEVENGGGSLTVPFVIDSIVKVTEECATKKSVEELAARVQALEESASNDGNILSEPIVLSFEQPIYSSDKEIEGLISGDKATITYVIGDGEEQTASGVITEQDGFISLASDDENAIALGKYEDMDIGLLVFLNTSDMATLGGSSAMLITGATNYPTIVIKNIAKAEVEYATKAETTDLITRVDALEEALKADKMLKEPVTFSALDESRISYVVLDYSLGSNYAEQVILNYSYNGEIKEVTLGGYTYAESTNTENIEGIVVLQERKGQDFSFYTEDGAIACFILDKASGNPLTDTLSYSENSCFIAIVQPRDNVTPVLPFVINSVRIAYTSKASFDELAGKVEALEEKLSDGNLLNEPIKSADPLADVVVRSVAIPSIGLEVGKAYKVTGYYNGTSMDTDNGATPFVLDCVAKPGSASTGIDGTVALESGDLVLADDNKFNFGIVDNLSIDWNDGTEAPTYLYDDAYCNIGFGGSGNNIVIQNFVIESIIKTADPILTLDESLYSDNCAGAPGFMLINDSPIEFEGGYEESTIELVYSVNYGEKKTALVDLHIVDGMPIMFNISGDNAGPYLLEGTNSNNGILFAAYLNMNINTGSAGSSIMFQTTGDYASPNTSTIKVWSLTKKIEYATKKSIEALNTRVSAIENEPKLPTVSTSDAGKFLRVSADGRWVAELLGNAEDLEV